MCKVDRGELLGVGGSWCWCCWRLLGEGENERKEVGRKGVGKGGQWLVWRPLLGQRPLGVLCFALLCSALLCFTSRLQYSAVSTSRRSEERDCDVSAINWGIN